MTIDDRVPYVEIALGNRADLSDTSGPSGQSRIQQWLWQSYLNIGMSYCFEQAEDSKDDQLVESTDVYDIGDTVRVPKAITAYRPDGTAIPIDIKDIKSIRRYNQNTEGPPSIVALFGTQFIYRPTPDAAYSITIDFWTKPTQSDPIGDTELLVPDDWLEVIDYGAILRGHISLLERDKAKEVQELLFGFQLPTSGKTVPGLIAQMWNRRQALAPSMDYAIVPQSARRSYTNV